MKFLIGILVFLLPWHALIVTTLKCKYGIDTNILRFWKEIIIIILLFITTIQVSSRHRIKDIYQNNYLLGTVTAFIICSIVYLFFPFFELKPSAFLGFRYDVFFLLTLIIGLYLQSIHTSISYILKILFSSTFLVLIIFLPWYIWGDISTLTTIFGYHNEVSTYTANSCISFAQNVNGEHRFQGTFGGPIRFSVFLTIVYLLCIGYILHEYLQRKKIVVATIGITSLLFLPAIFFSYSKTSILGLIFGIGVFLYLVRKIKYKQTFSKMAIRWIGFLLASPIIIISIWKHDLFLHLGAMVNRLDNLTKSIEMFFYNPIGYGLGIAGPASQIGRSIESAGSWTIAASTVTTTHRFLPENWYVQILLEQGIVGLSLFSAVLIIIGYQLYRIVKVQRDYLSIGIFSAYVALCFMALFTHAFEEAATSYILFLIIGISVRHLHHKKSLR